MAIILSHKIRIYPTDEDIVNLKKYIGYSRYLYNQAIVVQKQLWQECKDYRATFEDYNALSKQEKAECNRLYYPTKNRIRDNMVHNKQEWQCNYASKMVANSATEVYQAVQNALNKKMPNHKMPKFKKKKCSKMSFSCEGVTINADNELVIPKPSKSRLTGKQPSNPIVIKPIKLGEKIRFTGKITKATISCNKNNKWFVSVSVKLDQESENKYLAKLNRNRANKPTCGVDANVRGFHYNLPNKEGEYADWSTTEPRLLQQYKLIRYYTKCLNHKRKINPNWKTSKSYAKTKTKLSKSYAKAYNIQEDILNKFVLFLNENYSSVTIEDLDVNKMKMKKYLNKSLHRALFGRFKLKAENKLKHSNIDFIKADSYFASTQRCHCCGHIKIGDEKLGLYGDKYGNPHNRYVCYQCGLIADRDDNAVENLREFIYIK